MEVKKAETWTLWDVYLPLDTGFHCSQKQTWNL